VGEPAGDLTTREGAGAAVDEAVAALGGLDVVVHAAVHPLALEPVEAAAIDDARWDAVWEQAMRASLFLCQAAHPHLARRGGGRIVFVTPTLSLSGAPGLVPYATAVEGQRLLAKSAARQWGPQGITVNCVAPSAALAGVEPGALGAVSLAPPALGGPGDPEADVGPVVVFLAGTDSHFLTGATLAVDGGVWMAP
jgi:3-oxoacyl-[acyl-carrier protein] reductase